MYRPQFPIADAPEGFEWVPVIYCFDQTNTPALGVSLTIGEQTDDIPLVLDSDADFYWMATRIPSTFLRVQLKDPFTDPLSDDFVAAVLFADGEEPTALEAPGLHCPAGSSILIRLAAAL